MSDISATARREPNGTVDVYLSAPSVLRMTKPFSDGREYNEPVGGWMPVLAVDDERNVCVIGGEERAFFSRPSNGLGFVYLGQVPFAIPAAPWRWNQWIEFRDLHDRVRSFRKSPGLWVNWT